MQQTSLPPGQALLPLWQNSRAVGFEWNAGFLWERVGDLTFEELGESLAIVDGLPSLGEQSPVETDVSSRGPT